jgi:hypothetical protein
MGVDDFYIDEDPSRFTPPRIENGSTLTIGNTESSTFTMIVDQHFNWFQKKMIKWCFGIKVRDYRQ